MKDQAGHGIEVDPNKIDEHMSEPSESDVERLVMRNRYGDIEIGAEVAFQVENQSQWVGSNSGVLTHDGNDFVIDTVRSGRLTIDKGYDVYSNTVRPLGA